MLTAGTYYSIMVAPRDSFGNPANITQDLLTVHVRKVKNQVIALERCPDWSVTPSPPLRMVHRGGWSTQNVL